VRVRVRSDAVAVFGGRAPTDWAEFVQHVLCENADGGPGEKLIPVQQGECGIQFALQVALVEVAPADQQGRL